MVKLGKKSKRTPVRLRHKIEKASVAKQKKLRRQAKKDPTWRSKIKKDPGIPNLFPYKDRLLAEIEEKKRLKQEESLRLREEARERRKAENTASGIETADDDEPIDDLDVDLEDDDDDDEMDEGGDDSNPMAALLASARARAAEYEDDDDDEVDDGEDEMDEDDEEGAVLSLNQSDIPTLASQVKSKESSRRAFDKVFKQVAAAADVILYVLDARDPEGTRSKDVEREIMAAEAGSKRLILILNKIDLVPPPILKAWLIYLRRYFPTLPLKASNGAPNAHSFDHKQLTVKGTSETLFKALKSYAHTSQLKRAISVGVIGYPNVGKSSVINALTARLNRGQSSACPTGAEAGVTTSLREVKLDSKLKLIDSPGIVFPNASNKKSKKESDDARLVLLNAVPPKQITDPVPSVNLLLKRLSATESLLQKMLDVYGIPPLFPSNGDKTTDFLIQVARKRGRLGKGGVPNIQSAAMTVITDWRDGRIQGWVEPPVLPVVGVSTTGAGANSDPSTGADTKEIVTEWAKEFKIEGLWGDGESGDADEMIE
ncbi:P-loop containing nucleoside triphosphate hydrolase protein [Talaromyces proteolyticus]|uniref:P-loop containing nucleoside triphosphate hydrolase protein n=1 Tax=Talaromyces proteolyticus TaxID=1131652 RepID=A0AAD4KP49_9EURO|nr:P-loop containing nucleoside triphosphate hydrolase protein [Talaromyces proteolyticus]KAH8697297.1 P-loop containing nucleoside triphosphate hydrolase protein [Talaromyces proteolyticus]